VLSTDGVLQGMILMSLMGTLGCSLCWILEGTGKSTQIRVGGHTASGLLNLAWATPALEKYGCSVLLLNLSCPGIYLLIIDGVNFWRLWIKLVSKLLIELVVCVCSYHTATLMTSHSFEFVAMSIAA